MDCWKEEITMNKKIFSLILVLIILLSGCESSKETTKETAVNDLVNSDIVIEFETGTAKSTDEGTIVKYNDIMDYLYASPDKSEDELFEELAKQYGETADELKDFINSNMQAVNGSSLAENITDKETMEKITKQFFEANIDGELNNIDVELQGIGVISKFNFENEEDHSGVVKFEFSEDGSKAIVTQIKIDDHNISVSRSGEGNPTVASSP